MILGFSFFLFSTFVYEPILFKISMNANIVKTQFFFITSCMTLKVIQGHKLQPFYLKFTFLLFVLLINWRNKCCWTLWKNKVWLISLICRVASHGITIIQPSMLGNNPINNYEVEYLCILLLDLVRRVSVKPIACKLSGGKNCSSSFPFSLLSVGGGGRGEMRGR